MAGLWGPSARVFSLQTRDLHRRGGGGVGSALFRGGDSVLGVFYMVHFRRNNDNLEILGHGI